MFRNLNDVLNIQLNESDISNILRSPDSEKEKFILGIKIIYNQNSENRDIGFKLLKSIKRLDTCIFIEPSFVEELLSPIPRSERNFVSFGKTLQILRFILENASHTDSFVMAIHQNMVTYAQKSTIESNNLHDILALIKLITEHLNGANFKTEDMKQVCVVLMKSISEVPVPREAENIQAMNIDSIRIVEFFQSLNNYNQLHGIQRYVLDIAYNLITREEEVSPLTCLALSVIPDQLISNAVSHLLNATQNNSQKSIMNAIGRLIVWQRTTRFSVPLHIWIVRVLTALHNEKHYDLLKEIIATHIVQCYLTLILPAFQIPTFSVVQAMFELQRADEVFNKIAPRLVKVLKQLYSNHSEIFDSLLDVVADYVSNFSDAYITCKEVVEFLQHHNRATSHNISKHRRLTAASSLSNNVRIGLENLGNTCYMNSVLQALFMTKSFCNELLTMERQEREILVVQKIFGLLLFSDRSELDLKFALSCIRPVEFLPGIQHDSTEFMGSLLDKLHEADKKHIKIDVRLPEIEGAVGPCDDSEQDTMEVDDSAPVPVDKVIDNTSELNESTIVQKIFGGKISTTCVCSSCQSKSISIDSFRDLALSFPEKEKNEDDCDGESGFNVQQLLDYYFTTEQLTLDGDNQYHCEKCKILCDGVRCTELLQPPKNLILTLKHFSYDSRYHTRSKLLINKMFHNETVSVNVRSSHDGNSSRVVNYRLYAAVVHSGISLDSGHYYTFAREKDQTWYKFNDSFVSKSTLEELHSLNSPNTPYILFYRRISTASATVSSPGAACSSNQIASNNDQLPLFSALPALIRQFVAEDNAAYKKETKFSFQQGSLPKTNRWNDDDPPPSSCGSSYDVQQNRYIF